MSQAYGSMSQAYSPMPKRTRQCPKRTGQYPRRTGQCTKYIGQCITRTVNVPSVRANVPSVRVNVLSILGIWCQYRNFYILFDTLWLIWSVLLWRLLFPRISASVLIYGFIDLATQVNFFLSFVFQFRPHAKQCFYFPSLSRIDHGAVPNGVFIFPLCLPLRRSFPRLPHFVGCNLGNEMCVAARWNRSNNWVVMDSGIIVRVLKESKVDKLNVKGRARYLILLLYLPGSQMICLLAVSASVLPFELRV